MSGCIAKIFIEVRLRDLADRLVVEHEPAAAASQNGDVVTRVRTAVRHVKGPTINDDSTNAHSDVDDDGPERVELIRIGLSGRDGIEEAELKREGNTMRELGESLQVLLVLEALEVQSEDAWQLPESHSSFGFL